MTEPIQTPVELSEVLSTSPSQDETRTETWYAVFNDPTRIDAAVAAGMPEELADKLREPLHQSLSRAAAKRYWMWTNENRDEHPELLAQSGHALFKKQDVTTTPWALVTDDEIDEIDEGRRAYG